MYVVTCGELYGRIQKTGEDFSKHNTLQWKYHWWLLLLLLMIMVVMIMTMMIMMMMIINTYVKYKKLQLITKNTEVTKIYRNIKSLF
jgi:hypothetical protein